jgi:hypothetical protein
MFFHLTPFIERKSSRLLKEAGRQADLPDVMNEAAKMYEANLLG